MSADDLAFAAAFERGEIAPAAFGHAEHVRIAWTLLVPLAKPFPEAYAALATGLRALAARAGKPERYNETITLAFLALVHEERTRSARPAASFEAFWREAGDRLGRDALAALYPPEVLAGEAARTGLVLPRGRA